MKRIHLSIMVLIASSSIGYAGGDISPVTIYETDDAMLATEAYEREYVPPVIEEPVVVVETPVVETPVVETLVVETPATPPPPPPVEVAKIPAEVVPAVVVPATSIVEGPAANGFYMGLGITGVRYESACDCSTGGGSEDNVAAVGRVGYDFNRYVGLEARGMTTVSGDGGADVDHVGLFVKPMYPITDKANLYALIGAAKTKTSGDLQNVDAESLALGGGFEFDLSKDDPKSKKYARSFDGQGNQEHGLGLFVDYEKLVVKSDAPDLDTISAGVTYDF